MTAPIVKADENKEFLPKVLEVLKKGGLVISPTITNYNLICDATNADAVERVFEVKKRTKFGPLPVSLPYPELAEQYVHIPEWFDRGILSAMLPGEISFVFRQKYPFPDRLTCGLGSVAISCTTHKVFRSIVVGMNRPIAATSANLSGQGNIFISLQKAIDDIGDLVDIIVDAGPTEAELAGGGDRVNTIIDLTFEVPYLVRPGWVPLERVLKFVPNLNTDLAAYQKALQKRVATPGVQSATAGQ